MAKTKIVAQNMLRDCSILPAYLPPSADARASKAKPH